MSWLEHVKKFRESKPGISYKEALKGASKSYKKQSGRGPEHERFSAEVYKKPDDRKDVRDYKYLGGDEEQGVWRSPRDVIIAFRGTSNRMDVKTDAILSVGALRKTKRYKKSLAFAKEIKQASTIPVIVTGHSLGGSIATEIGRELGLKTFAYNPGMSVKENVRSKTDKMACLIKPKGKKCQRAKMVNVERTLGDPVSVIGRNTMNTKHKLPKQLNIHSIMNWSETMLKD